MANTIPFREDTWPENNYVHLKNRVKAGDFNRANGLQIKAKIGAQAGSPDSVGLSGNIEIFYGPLAWCAVMIRRFEGEWLLDQLDEAADLLGRDGSMPDNVDDRLRVAEEIPFFITGPVDAQIAELMVPFAPSETSDGSSDESDASGQAATKTTRPSRSKK